jgi:hypothetical protein
MGANEGPCATNGSIVGGERRGLKRKLLRLQEHAAMTESAKIRQRWIQCRSFIVD